MRHINFGKSSVDNNPVALFVMSPAPMETPQFIRQFFCVHTVEIKILQHPAQMRGKFSCRKKLQPPRLNKQRSELRGHLVRVNPDHLLHPRLYLVPELIGMDQRLSRRSARSAVRY